MYVGGGGAGQGGFGKQGGSGTSVWPKLLANADDGDDVSGSVWNELDIHPWNQDSGSVGNIECYIEAVAQDFPVRKW